MSFGVYIFLVTVVIVLLRWILFAIYEQTDDGPSFFVFMLNPHSHPTDRFRPLMLGVLLVAAVVGFYLID